MRLRAALALVVAAVGAAAVGVGFATGREGGAPSPGSGPVAVERPALRPRPDVTPGERSEPEPEAAEAERTSMDERIRERAAPVVEVRVVDERGAPVAGAEIHSYLSHAFTDAEGRAWVAKFGWDMGSPSQDRRCKTVRVRAAGFESAEHYGTLSPFPYERIRLRRAVGGIEGRCVDTAGRPLAGVVLRLGEDEFRSGEDGRFACASAPRRRLALTGESKSHVARPVTVVPPQSGVEVVLSRWARVRGILVPPASGNASEAAIARAGEKWGRTVRAGPFDVRVEPGPVEVRRGAQVLRALTLAEGEDADVGEVELADDPPPGEADARAEGDESAPWIDLEFAGADLPYLSLGATFDDLGYRPLGYAHPEEGPVRLTLPSERLRALVIGHVFDGPRWRTPAAVRTRVELRTPRAAHVSLRLVDGRGQSVEDGIVAVRWSDGHAIAATCRRALAPWFARSGVVRADTLGPGEFRIDGVTAGAYDLAWSAEGDDWLRLAAEVVMPDPPVALELGEIRLPEPASLRVRAVTALGPPPFAIVRVSAAGGESFVRAGADGMATAPVGDRAGLVVEVETADGLCGSVAIDERGPLPPEVEVRATR